MNTTVLRTWLEANKEHIKLTEIYAPVQSGAPFLMIRLDCADWSAVKESSNESFNLGVKAVKKRFAEKVPALVVKRRKPRKQNEEVKKTEV